MPAFHDNKLKMVSLDESGDDPTYSPPRKSAKVSKAPKSKSSSNSKAKPNNAELKSDSMLNSRPVVKRKRSPGRNSHLYSDLKGYLLESSSGQSNKRLTLNDGQMYSPPHLGNSDAVTSDAVLMVPSYGLFTNDNADWGEQVNIGGQHIEAQNGLLVGSHDSGARTLAVPPESPRFNTFAASAPLPSNQFAFTHDLNVGGPHYNFGVATSFSNDNLDAMLHNNSSQSLGYQAVQGAGYEGTASHNVGGTMSMQLKEESGSESEEREAEVCTLKVPKINKDGAPRKPRQPRPKLLKWTDNDWKNAMLGLVWACGEVGLPIPFDQAAQVVATSCTAGALQQALLKLRDKQIAEGYQIPSLKMAWTRKNKRSNSTPFNADEIIEQSHEPGKWQPKKAATRQAATQSNIVTLHVSTKEKLANPHPHTPHAFATNKGSPVNVAEPNIHRNLGAREDLHVPLVADGSDSSAVVLNDAMKGAAVDPWNSLQISAPNNSGNKLDHASLRAKYGNPPQFELFGGMRAQRPLDPQDSPSERSGYTALTSFAEASMINDGWKPCEMPLGNYYCNDFDDPLPTSSGAGVDVVDGTTQTNLFDGDNRQGPFVLGAWAGNPLDHPFSDLKSGDILASSDVFAYRGPRPTTPPPTAAAEREVANRLVSSNRDDGAFNPQGNTSYVRVNEEELDHLDDLTYEDFLNGDF